jgi:tRNA threonylcarbamoyladenosine modification (KEOPS) complex Cgi121 subunit
MASIRRPQRGYAMRSSSEIVRVYPFIVESGKMENWLESISDILQDDDIAVLATRDAVYNSTHVASAFLHASRAIDRNKARARDPSIEILRWLTGSRQVQRALDLSGSPKAGSVILLMVAEGSYFGNMSSNLPTVLEEKWNGPGIEGLKTLDPESENVFGGNNTAELLGIIVNDRYDMELAVLEMVALTDL